MSTINQGHMMYGSWDIKCKGQSFLSFWAIFLPFDPPNNAKSQNFEKIKKSLKILSFYICVPQMTIMVYGSWYIKHDRQNFLSFWAIFCPFPPNNPENQNLEKRKKLLEISFTQVYHKWQSYYIWFLRYQLQQRFFLSSWTTFCPFTPLTVQKMEIYIKKWKHLEISSFYTSVPKLKITGYTVLEIWCVMDVIVVFHFGQFLPFYPP